MKIELQCLLVLVWIHLLVWIPYIINMVCRLGLAQAIGYEETVNPLAEWAVRMKKAHYNMVENHFIFFALIFLFYQNQAFDRGSEIACQVYVFARIAHLIAYTFAIPLGARTISFAVSIACKFYLAIQLFSIMM